MRNHTAARGRAMQPQAQDHCAEGAGMSCKISSASGRGDEPPPQALAARDDLARLPARSIALAGGYAPRHSLAPVDDAQDCAKDSCRQKWLSTRSGDP